MFAAGKLNAAYPHGPSLLLCLLYTPDPSSDEQVPLAKFPIQYPRVPGHEIVGEVVAIPPTEKYWKVGQRVGGGWHGGHCMACSSCRRGDYITCQNLDVNGAHTASV